MGGDQGREARDFRKTGNGEGEAGQDHRQGLPREGPQGRVLRASESVASPRGGSACASPFPPLASLPPRNIRVILSRLAGGCVVMHGLLQCQDARRGRSHVLHVCLAGTKKKKGGKREKRGEKGKKKKKKS